MTNYNERLYEIIDKHRHDVDMDFSADIRHYKNTNETVDGITSLIKELVAEAKPDRQPPMKMGNPTKESSDLDKMIFAKKKGHNEAIDQFEQNLLKALEEV
jgi:hypothetical protein